MAKIHYIPASKVSTDQRKINKHLWHLWFWPVAIIHGVLKIGFVSGLMKMALIFSFIIMVVNWGDSGTYDVWIFLLCLLCVSAVNFFTTHFDPTQYLESKKK